MKSVIRLKFTSGLKFRFVWGLLILITLIFYLWTVSHGLKANLISSQEYQTNFQSLAKSFSEGHLYLQQVPAPELLKLDDPYNPEKNAPYKILDAALYNGKFYLYFSPLYSLLIHLPFYTLTGSFLSEKLIGAVLSFSTCLLYFFTFLKIFKKKKIKISEPRKLLYFLTLMTSSGFLYLLRRVEIWESAIILAQFFVSCVVYFSSQIYYEENSHVKRGTVLLLGVFSGLTIWARPSLVFLIAPLLILLFIRLSQSKRMASKAIILAVPVFFFVILILAYNYIRFDNPFEFGISYNLGIADFRVQPLFSLIWFPIASFGYLFNDVNIRYTFPFFLAKGQELPFEPGIVGFGTETLIGIFQMPLTVMTVPIIFYIIGQIRRGVNNSRPEISRSSASNDVLKFILVLFAGGFLTLFFNSFLTLTCWRYMMDFLPIFVFACTLSLAWLTKTEYLNSFLVYLTSILCITSIFLHFFLSFTGYGDSFASNNPNSYEIIKAFFDTPVLTWKEIIQSQILELPPYLWSE